MPRKPNRKKNKKIVEEVASTPESPGRGRAVLDYLTEKLKPVDNAVTRYLQGVDASTLIGANPYVQGQISRGAMGLVDNVYLPMRNLVSKEPLTGGERLLRARDIVADPRMQTALRAVPAAAVGTGVLGLGAIGDAVFESEEERLLRQYLEMISNGGY